MTNKKFFFALILSAMMCVPMSLNAQVTIGSGDAPRATLDVVAADGIHPGIIVPNVSRQRLNTEVHNAEQTGAVVYVYELNGTNTGRTVNVTAVGLHYFDGALWQRMRGEDAVVYTGAGLVRVNAATNIIDLHSSATADRVIGVLGANTTPVYTQVQTAMIAPRAVTGAELFTTPTANRVLAVTTASSSPQYVQIVNAMIADNAINTRTITANAVTNAEIAANTIQLNRLARTGTEGQVLTSRGINQDAHWTTPANTTYAPGTLITITGANNAINIASSATANRLIGVTTANSAPQYVQVNNAMIADNAVTTRTIAPNAVTNAEIAANTIQHDRMTGTGSTAGQILTSTGEHTPPVWATPPYTEYASITRGLRWSFDARVRNEFTGGVFLLMTYTNNSIRIRIRYNNGSRRMASFGTSGFVALDETWRYVPIGMHMIWLSWGAGALYVESTEPLDPNVHVGQILRLR